MAGFLNKLDLPTLLMILIMGGGNILFTKEDGRLTREEAVQVAREVHALHNALGEFEARQKAMLESQKIDNDAQTKLIEQQTEMLEELRRYERKNNSAPADEGGTRSSHAHPQSQFD